LTRKIQCQEVYVVITPPRRGAMTGAARAGQVSNESVRIRADLSVTLSTASLPTGTIMAPPTPCATRMRLSSARLVLAAQRTDATTKIAMAARNTRRAPKRRAIQPLSGMSAASVSR
jgi:hypothetical protein